MTTFTTTSHVSSHFLTLTREVQKADKEFQKQWANGTFPGWPKETESVLANTGAHLDLSAFSSWEELASLGLDRLKSALMALGLKCGGTLEERAQRLFSTKGKKHIDPSLMAKKTGGKSNTREHMRQKEIASLEAALYRSQSLFPNKGAPQKKMYSASRLVQKANVMTVTPTQVKATTRRKTMMMSHIIRRTCHWDGMENRFRIGCTNYTV